MKRVIIVLMMLVGIAFSANISESATNGNSNRGYEYINFLIAD